VTRPAATPGDAPRGAPRALELKYRVTDPNVAAALLGLPAIGPFAAEGPVETDETLDRFLDTDDGAFRAIRHAVRLRRVGDTTTLTVKGPSRPGPGGSVSRIELEETVDGDDPGRWPRSPARDLVDAIRGFRALHEVARLAQRRRHRLLRRGRTTVELTVDEVEVRDGERPVASWLEVEAELRAGSALALERLGRALAEAGGLEPSPESKFAAALRALETARPAAATASPEPSPGDMPLADLARLVVTTQLDRILANEPAARAGDDEAVHRMRVATRRLRAGWDVFDDVLPPARTVRRDVRDLARALGAARDLDVLSAYLDAATAASPSEDRAALARLAEAWRARRGDAGKRLSALLDTRRQRRLPDRLRRALGVDARHGGRSADPRRVRDAAGSRAWAAYEAVRAYEPALPSADTATLHRLRIACKRLRYTLEFLAPALGPAADRLIARTVALQDLLGTLHDADVAGALARSYLEERRGTLTGKDVAAIERFAAHAAADVGRYRDAVPRTWRGLGGRAFRRTLAGLLAGL
jgi:CHAD domain-containing protein